MSTKLFSIAGVLLVFALMLLTTGKPGSSSRKATEKGSQLLDLDNSPMNLSDVKGKVVFINNWASWCPPCVAEMPSIQKLKNELNKTDFVFVMVSYDEDRARAVSFMKKRGYDFNVYFPGAKYPYGTESIPASYILDRKGKLIQEHKGMRDYSTKEMVALMKAVAGH